jgi:hypothetical protein
MHEERMARTSAPWIEMPPSLSPESAASVRAAAFAVLRLGVRYLPVVDDGILVGLVAVGDLRRPHRTPRPVRPGSDPAVDGGDGPGAGNGIGLRPSLQPSYQTVITGAVLLVAAGVDALSRRRVTARRP